MNRKIEILAPAGSWETLQAEIYAGADAVYIGGDRFGARAFADNPNRDTLCEAIDFVHLHGKKLYLTVNTLLSEKELEEELYEWILPFYERGLDAAIVQDVGVLSFLHQEFPELPLHASTQMSLWSGESADKLKKYGVTRFVPARELSIEELRKIRKQTELELEVFVHGALCYAYSGQCLMSSIIGGRSGNRGMCAQPCRLPYTAEGKQGYFLSPKDVCTLRNIPELILAGIDSFKIEGRMKGMEYGALTTKLYRKYTDIFLREGETSYRKRLGEKKAELEKDIQALMDLYNRGGSCGGYLFEKDKHDILFSEKNNHFGVKVGKVVEATNRKASFQTEQEISYQDVLEFRKKDGTAAYEYTVKEPVKAGKLAFTNILPGSEVFPGQYVYRVRNNQLRNEIQGWNRKKIPLKATFIAEEGKEIRFLVTDKNEVGEAVGCLPQRAEKRAVTEEEVRKRLMRTGDSLFEFSELHILLDKNLFLPMGEINRLRRDAIDDFANRVKKSYHRQVKGEKEAKAYANSSNCVKSVFGMREEVVVSIRKQEQLMAVLDCPKITMVLCPLEVFSPEDWRENKSKILASGKIPAFSFPKPFHGRTEEVFLKRFREEDFKDAVAIANSWDMWLVCKKWKLPILLDAGFYVTNHRAACFYKENGAIGFHSPLDAKEQERRACEEMGGIVSVYGRIPLMTTRACVSACTSACEKKEKELVLENSHGDKFFVANYCDYCYNTIYTKDVFEDLNTYQKMRFDFAEETVETIGKVLERWRIL